MFILVDENGNIYACTNESRLINNTKIKMSDASIIKFSNSKRLMGIGSHVDKNILIFDLSLYHQE